MVLGALDCPAHRSACDTKAHPDPPRTEPADCPTQSLEDKADNTEYEPGKPADNDCQPSRPSDAAMATLNPGMVGSLISAESTPAPFFPHCPLDEDPQDKVIAYHSQDKPSINNKARIGFHFSSLSVLFLRDYSESALLRKFVFLSVESTNFDELCGKKNSPKKQGPRREPSMTNLI